jgi:hypothetical protein
MKSFVLVVIVVCLAGLCCGCSSEQEELSGDQLELFKELNEVLESVTDAASVDGAIPKLEQLNTKLAALAARPAMKTRLTKEEREDGIKKYGRDLAKQGGAAAAHVVRISSIEGIKKEDVKRLQDTIKDIDLGG